jgi:hypothetical protein
MYDKGGMEILSCGGVYAWRQKCDMFMKLYHRHDRSKKQERRTDIRERA